MYYTVCIYKMCSTYNVLHRAYGMSNRLAKVTTATTKRPEKCQTF